MGRDPFVASIYCIMCGLVMSIGIDMCCIFCLFYFYLVFLSFYDLKWLLLGTYLGFLLYL